MKSIASFLMATVLILGGVPCYAGTSNGMTLYDSFNGKSINADKWVGYEWLSDTANRVARESVRWVEDRRLRLGISACACTTCPEGSSITVQERLIALDPTIQDATAIQAIAEIGQLTVVGSDSDANKEIPAQARMRIMKFFFNNTENPGNAIGDVIAWIGVRRTSGSTNPTNTLTVTGNVSVCTDETCTESLTYGQVDITTLRISAARRPSMANLYMEWDAQNHQFIFKCNNKTQGISYSEDWATSPPWIKHMSLRAEGMVPNDATGDRPKASIDSYIDNIWYK